MRNTAGEPASDPSASDPSAGPGPLGVVATRLVQAIVSVGIDGLGPWQPAIDVSRAALETSWTVEEAVGQIKTEHSRLAARSGFLTGLGGFVTLPVALPANVVGFTLVGARMAAAVASARGYDVARDDVRTAVLLTLVGGDITGPVARLGVARPGQLTQAALGELDAGSLALLNRAVAFRLLVLVGRRGMARLGRAIPLAGGMAGAGLDAWGLRRVAAETDRVFPPRAPSRRELD